MNMPNPVSFPQNVFTIPMAKKITPKIQLMMFQKIDLFIMFVLLYLSLLVHLIIIASLIFCL